MSITGLALAVASGALLFMARAPDYVREPLFGLKMALLLAALLNAAINTLWLRSTARGFAQGATGVAGIMLWLGVITTGRLIGCR